MTVARLGGDQKRKEVEVVDSTSTPAGSTTGAGSIPHPTDLAGMGFRTPRGASVEPSGGLLRGTLPTPLAVGLVGSWLSPRGAAVPPLYPSSTRLSPGGDDCGRNSLTNP